MDNNKNCTVCNMKLDVVNYLKNRTVCKTCYNKNRRKMINKENNFILESLNNKIDDVLDLLEVIKSRIPRSTRT